VGQRSGYFAEKSQAKFKQKKGQGRKILYLELEEELVL
jgi:hypothetical protein